MLDQNKCGTIVGIVQGLEVTYFLDLVAYILRKNVFRAGKMLGKSYKIFGNENLERLNNENFKLVLFCSYKKKEDSFASQICKDADRITKEFMFGNFEYYEKINEDVDQGWEDAIFKEKIDLQAYKIYTSGSNSFLKNTKNTLLSLGLNENQLFYL